jgi:hypothetical protein
MFLAGITLIRYAQSRKIRKANNLIIFGSYKPKGLNMIAEIGISHICLSEENLSFENNYIT